MRLLHAWLVVGGLVFLGVILYYTTSHHPVLQQLQVLRGKPTDTVPRMRSGNYTAIQSLLLDTADHDGIIYLSSVDSAYLCMAINLYETSFKRLGIQNYLFTCSDAKAHETLQGRGINSIHYMDDAASDKAVIYGTKEFRRKTHLKTKITLDALLLQLTVVLVDVDIIFFKDPLPYLDCADCDIQIQLDVVEGNSGFYMARPTDPSITLHKKAWQTAQTQGESISNQKVLDRNMETMQKYGQIKVKSLDTNLFPSGYVYFEEKMRMFYSDNPPKEEVILHNNWIVSMEAKRYRFKELLWWYDDTNGYYTDETRKYLTYENPQDFGEANTQRVETEALMSAFIIGYLLNRTVILPTFTCHHCKYGACKVVSKKCSFNTHYKLMDFDSVWGEQYREHVFLDNPKVPKATKLSSKTYFISRPHGSYYINTAPSGVEVRTPKSVEQGPTPAEIREWFGANTEPVLRFHSMYNILEALRTEAVFAKIKQALNEATDYRQY